ncbi:MAG: Tat pathway signal protein [Rhizobiales bacterium 35-68-8]|nr:MAG: Tat pathway signal protein [Rhizobiales bacterium 35-68-8]
MILSRRTFCAGLLATAAVPGTARAADTPYPTRPIRLMVPYAAGGGTDGIARIVAQGVSERLGQALVVDNNGAAGGNVATQQVANAEPDGYTILMANQGPMVVNPHLFRNVKIDPLKAFAPITLITAAPLLVVVPKASPFKTIQDLIAFAAKNPDKLTYCSAGNGSASHLAGVLLLQVTGVQAVHVPYKGAGPALNDLLGDRMDFMVTTVPSVLGLAQRGDVRMLAVTSRDRIKKFADVPTVAESGWPAYEASAWYGFAAPKGTPQPIIDKLRIATVETINTGVVRERLESEGALPIGDTPDQFMAMMKAESARWAQVIKVANIAID